ncbi:helix-turn-helix domain-containing protein [Flavobacterium procerum]|uniref:Helix-turn-helix domain-containing protein n=1 Tax=Flavobacterium procerum TaxID=1455569 RepID=A0ABV6BW30_9FLAO
MRLKRKISQDSMAYLINITQATYSRKERGQSGITPAEWDKIAEVLDVEKSEIYENSCSSIQYGNLKRRNTYIPPELIEEIKSLRKENSSLKQEIRRLKT